MRDSLLDQFWEAQGITELVQQILAGKLGFCYKCVYWCGCGKEDCAECMWHNTDTFGCRACNAFQLKQRPKDF